MKSTRPYFRTFYGTLLLIALVAAPSAAANPAKPVAGDSVSRLWSRLLDQIRAFLPIAETDRDYRENAGEDGPSIDPLGISAPNSESSQGEGGPSIDPLG